MSLTYFSITIGIIANTVGLILMLIKVSTKIATQNAIQTERIKTLEHQVNNDITGRKAVGEMRQDLAVIKSEIINIKRDLQNITKPTA